MTKAITVQVANFTLRLEQSQWKVTVRTAQNVKGRGLRYRVVCGSGVHSSQLRGVGAQSSE